MFRQYPTLTKKIKTFAAGVGFGFKYTVEVQNFLQQQYQVRETELSVVERLCKTMDILDKDKYFIPLKNALLEKKI